MREVWKTYKSESLHESQKFELSNTGKIKSHNQDEPTLLKGHINNGYLTFSTRKKDGKRTLTYVHKAVAELFVEKTNEDQTLVIHLDYNRLNNHASNLKWVNTQEAERHAVSDKNPKGSKLKHTQRYYSQTPPSRRLHSAKLSEIQVLKIKRMINDPNRKTRMRIIAKQFGIGVDHLYRIKNGTSWGWLTEDFLKYGSDLARFENSIKSKKKPND